MSIQAFEKLMRFLDRLEQEHIHYTLARQRDEAIMVSVSVPGARWEVEFFADGSVEAEQFISSGDIYDEAVLDDLLAQQSDSPDELIPEPAVAD